MYGDIIEPADPVLQKRANELEIERREAEIEKIRSSAAESLGYRLANFGRAFMFVAVGVAALVVAL
ncbi:MAG: hypothetical protein ACREO0_08825 [Pseudoxanthomonas sp.]